MTDLTTQLIEQVNDANAQRHTLAIEGNGTKAHLGRQITCDQTLSLGRHTGVTDYSPDELYITARAGTKVSEVQALLAENRQTLAFDPPHFNQQATLGGTLAANLSGPGRPWLGSGRDMLLGVKLINGLGEYLTFGGQVMKNVAGYDVSRLQAGAMGTLGVITELSLKVVPMAETELTCVLDLGADSAITKMNQLGALPLPFSGMMWLSNQLYIRLSGEASAVKAAAQTIGGQPCDGDIWQAVREQTHSFFSGRSKTWRFSLASTAPNALPEAPWLIEWGGSQRWLRGDSEWQRLSQIAEENLGQVSLIHGAQADEERFQTPAEPLVRLQKRLKDAFDPHYTLNPGRLYHWM